MKPTMGLWASYIPCMSGPILDPPPQSRMRSSTRVVEVTRAGASFGTALAIVISWSVNHSILWAIIHGLFSWFYVVYFALTR